MKVAFKILTAAILLICIILSPLNLQRAHAAPVIEEANQAGLAIMEVLELISVHYKGDIDFDRLVSYAISGMAEALGDEFSYFMPTEETEVFVDGFAPTRLLFGIIFGSDLSGNTIIHQVLYGSSAQEEGLRPGDIILSINSVSAAGLGLSDVTSMLIGVPVGQVAIIEYLRDDEKLSVEIYRRILPNPSVFIYEIDELLEDAARMPDTRIIYISFIGEATADELRFNIAKLQEEGVRNIILDLRNNRGGYMDIGLAICQMLVSYGPVLVLRNNLGSTAVFYSELEQAPFEEIVVLVDRGTASAGEVIAAALRDRGATLIGEQTFGKTTMQHFFELSIGYLRLTTHEVFTPRGERIHYIGLIPDIKINFPSFLIYNPYEPDNTLEAVKEMLEFLGFYNEEPENVDIQLIATLNAQFIELMRSDDLVLREAYEYIRGK